MNHDPQNPDIRADGKRIPTLFAYRDENGVDRARLRLESMTGETSHTRAAEHDFERAEAGLRSAERILNTYEDMGRDDRPP